MSWHLSLKFENNQKNCKLKTPKELSENNQGENIFMAFGFPNPPVSNYTYAIQGWYDELKWPGYNFKNPGFFENPGTSHFTQVWV